MPLGDPLVGEKSSDCPLCDLNALRTTDRYIEHELCAYTSNSHWKAVEAAEKVLPGSGIIIPRTHTVSPFALSTAEWAATHVLLVEVKELIDELFQPDGYNIGWNVNRTGGQEVAHAHLHVIPRFADEPFAGRGLRSWLKRPENVRASLRDLRS